MCGQELQRWKFAQIVSLIGLGGLLWAYTGEWWACLLLAGASGILFNLKHPILVDLPALCLALAAAVAAQHSIWWLAVGLALLAGCTKETAPVFAAAYAWNPLLLVGLVPVGVRLLFSAGDDPVPVGPATEALAHPLRSSLEHHRVLPLWVWVLPWGVLLAGLANPSPQLWVALALAYGQCVIATDTVRLYVWALPVMALCAVPVLSGPFLALALVLHVANPFKTDGI